MAKKQPDDAVYRTFYEPFKKNPARQEKVKIENMYLRLLAEMAVQRFKWEGLPDTIDERFLELTLQRNALSIFYYDESVGRYLAVRGAGTGINIYDNPPQFYTIGIGMPSKTLKPNECVPIWANALRIPDHDVITTYAKRLAEIERTIDINILNMRHPVLIACDESERLSMENAFKQVKEGVPVIAGTPLLGENIGAKITTFNLGGDADENSVKQLLYAKANIWNDCMTFLGINNTNQEKRERMITDEVASNESQIVAYRNVGLSARKRACEQINRVFPKLNVSVHWNADVSHMADLGISAFDERG